MGSVICPFATREFERIKENHSTLASTGCTRDFCQSGRIIHTDEPRVGENRSIESLEHDAEGFLRDLHREGFFDSDEALEERIQQALYEIRAGAVKGVIRETKEPGMVGGNWTQTPEEVEFGLRRAWRNSRKCIMRSHCEDLKLCDLRTVTSSAKMAVELIKALSKAFNDGNILPTAFVFPPRTPNNRGPMIWNDQLLTFAGYESEDGSILGDPKNAQFTKDAIELGWVPPKNKTRFDLLPVIVMAEGDLPVIVELPANLSRLIQIRHPQYPQMDELDLKWAAFPALSRLGFDIGGVQYTATPFIGWFMEAEIGTRNLADSFRYNVLPDVVKALGLAKHALVDVDSFEDLPEYEKLALLSLAQTELNYAVQHSYIREKVTMSDSLTASMKFSRYDDEFQKKHGYRLPSDPFWVAPPQGSIIPVWHRGAAPNYQPKPMICRHVQEPAKAWKREKSSWPLSSAQIFGPSAVLANTTPSPSIPSPIKNVDTSLTESILSFRMTSDYLTVSKDNDWPLVAAKLLSKAVMLMDSSTRSMRTSSESTLTSGGDDILEVSSSYTDASADEDEDESSAIIPEVPARIVRYAQDLNSSFSDGKLLMTSPRVEEIDEGSLRVTMDLGTTSYGPLSCIQVLPLNALSKVERALDALGVNGSSTLRLTDADNPTYTTYLREYADLELPFLELNWLETVTSSTDITVNKEKLEGLSVLGALEYLQHEGVFDHPEVDLNLPYDMCLDMPLLQTRTYSVASSLRYIQEIQGQKEGGGNEIDLIVKVYKRGRFSGIYLRDMSLDPSQAAMKFRFVDSIAANRMPQEPHLDNLVPIIAVTTGAGFGPVRSLLQERIAIAREAVAAGKPLPSRKQGISLFVGLQRGDVALVTDILVEASAYNLIDMFFMVPSNAAKVRVHDKMKMPGVAEELKDKVMQQGAKVFVCSGPVAAKEIGRAMDSILGVKARKTMGVRYVEEVF
ncbi:nitric oxide synthase [Collybia nuda]|uniref:nitric-oxide synthase (NADPH) n=1 Tax=Collybia nuda TaxID=64659 RepID=A0A9P6CLZ8_9AGAR|nr:nitric oxide synthase [Collybia nuda]